ncbi:hypothetical protein AGMMS50262_21490 [Bacteroidia bacterium]|nr:hypothetical protein AGMMS50262_21490 [Bacteroidia bacterium]
MYAQDTYQDYNTPRLDESFGEIDNISNYGQLNASSPLTLYDMFTSQEDRLGPPFNETNDWDNAYALGEVAPIKDNLSFMGLCVVIYALFLLLNRVAKINRLPNETA